MNILIALLQVIVGMAAVIAALASFVMFKSFRWPAMAFWGMKILVPAISPVLVLVGLITVITGLFTVSVWLTILGLYVTCVYVIHIYLVTEEPDMPKRFQRFFPPQPMRLLLPKVPDPVWKKDIVYATIPGTDRRLLCDLWEPANSVQRSGLAFIFMHGGAFYFLDKDCGTRPFFRQLTAQGHVIMDVAYRMAPEVGIMEMIHDVKRAVAWMKESAEIYKVDPGKIVVGGGSAGAHLALMTAYTINDTRFSPPELKDADLGVCGVAAIYPPVDLAGLYYHTNQHLTTRENPDRPRKKVPAKTPPIVKKMIGKDYHRLGLDKNLLEVGFMAPLMGGHPDEVPDRYAFFSPINYVSPDNPPTLIIQGLHDIMAPARYTIKLSRMLTTNHVPVISHFLPQADHGFDMALYSISPVAHTALYETGRFLALLAEQKAVRPKGKPVKPEVAMVF